VPRGYTIEQCDEILRICPDGCADLCAMVLRGLARKRHLHARQGSARISAANSKRSLESWDRRRAEAAVLKEG